MIHTLHPAAGALGMAVIATFWLSTVVAEAIGGPADSFALMQGIELLAGAVNLALVGLSLRNGLVLTRRFARA